MNDYINSFLVREFYNESRKQCYVKYEVGVLAWEIISRVSQPFGLLLIEGPFLLFDILTLFLAFFLFYGGVICQYKSSSLRLEFGLNI